MSDAQEELYHVRKRLGVRALFIGERIDIRALERTRYLAVSPLAVPAGDRGCAVLFRYGTVVLFDLTPLEEASFLESLRPFVDQPFEEPESEDITIIVDPQASESVDASDNIRLNEPDIRRLQIVADILAKSTVLGRFESLVGQVFERVEPLGIELKRKGRTGSQGKDLLRQIGDLLIMQHKMVGRVEIVEKPELLWEHPSLDKLFLRLQDEYELRERSRILEQKFSLISRTIETVLKLLDNKRTLRVEWYIVILIVVEIAISLYSILVAP